VDSVDKSKKMFSKDSWILSEKFVLSSGIALILFGKESEKERFAILRLKDFFRLTNLLLKNKNRT